MKRMGVFICHCGKNIAGTVDIEKVKEALTGYSGLEFVGDYMYMCSEPGQALLSDIITEKKLDGIVVGCCSPSLHETTFRTVTLGSGLNPYQCEIANIREQCSWVHQDDKELATQKAIRIIKSSIEAERRNDDLEPIRVPVTHSPGGGRQVGEFRIRIERVRLRWRPVSEDGRNPAGRRR